MKAHTQATAEARDAPLYLRTDISPEELFKAIGRLRKEARDEIDRLIRFLDDTDNHMELEPDDEGDDSEMEDDDPAEDDELREPSLGSLGDHHPNQERWAAGSRRDLEQDDAESGIADYDGLLEQVGTQDWQQGAMA
ncbi:hypothetical protein [Bradyrhizobium sp. AZCC 2289]|jgi:hypothetical protein|uniref:hypothetical protein n=1 Tax=Bradyrhizobium sp. AZCC 2289 TaxID=3117026 RepID=UPI002FF2F197